MIPNKKVEPRKIATRRLTVDKVLKGPWQEIIGDSDVGDKVWLSEYNDTQGNSRMIIADWLTISVLAVDLAADEISKLRKIQLEKVKAGTVLEYRKFSLNGNKPEEAIFNQPDFVTIVENA